MNEKLEMHMMKLYEFLVWFETKYTKECRKYLKEFEEWRREED